MLTLSHILKNCYGLCVFSYSAYASVLASSQHGNQRSVSGLYPSHCTKNCLPHPWVCWSIILSMKYSVSPSVVMIGPGQSNLWGGRGCHHSQCKAVEVKSGMFGRSWLLLVGAVCMLMIPGMLS